MGDPLGLLGAVAAQTSGSGDDPNDQRLREGVIVAGSYDPIGIQFGTVTMPSVLVLIGDQYAAADEDNSDELEVVRCRLATTQIGDQYGPVGGERVLVIRARTGRIALLEHGPDDSPQVPSGERWIAHAQPGSDPVWNSILKLTNDGKAAGDGLGGLALKTVAAGIGDDFQNLTAQEAAIVVQHIQDFAASIMSDMMQSFITKTAAALVAASVGAATPLQQALAYQAATTVANWIVDNITAPTIPLGSAISRIANP